MRKLILINSLLLWTCLATDPAQARSASDSCTYAIRGSIRDAETQQPVPYATVTIKHTRQGTVADEHGTFVLDQLCSVGYTLVCSSVGYKPVTHHHDAHHGEPIIYMAATTSELESVVVEGKAIVGDMQSMAMNRMHRDELATDATRSLASAVSNVQGVTFTPPHWS